MISIRNFFLWAISIGVILFSNSLAARAYNDNEVFSDTILNPDIKTVQLYVDPLMLSNPVIPLRGTAQLHLSFDDLSGEKKNYYYTIIQCNYDWTKSELNSFDFLEGDNNAEIRDYKFSFNTNQTYTHYSLLFPNEDMHITKSGNYVIEVYADNDPEQLILMRRFIVFESMVQINSNVQQCDDVSKSQTFQQVNFTILHHGLDISNAFTDVKVLLMQNFRWDNAITNVQPQFAKPDELDYNYATQTSFPGGKEFRYFDARTTRYRTDRVNKLEEKDHTFLLTLFNDEVRNRQPYFYRQDIDGKFIPGTLDFIDQDAQADYVWVKFTLPMDYPLHGSKIFLLGKFTDWKLMPQFEMHYNSSTSVYEATLYLKQGYYEYLYRLASNELDDDDLMEGNSYETENTYQIFVYWRPFGSRYDQVIGYKNTDTFNH